MSQQAQILSRHGPSTGRGRVASPLSVEEHSWSHLNRLGEALQRRDFRVPFACLDAADLGGVNPAAFRDLLLGEPERGSGKPQVVSEIAQGVIVGLGASDLHRKLHKSWTIVLLSMGRRSHSEPGNRRDRGRSVAKQKRGRSRGVPLTGERGPALAAD